ncbi:MAG TPA: CHASE2 domain-containing protein [Spirochaetia bacterium]|nr:CHASE2 domain-containing protein [Spirochaetia bacterium]
MKRDLTLTIAIPSIAVLIFAAINLIPAYQTSELRVYDALLHVKPAIAEDPSILLLDIDDLAIAKVGTWPWSRDKMAEGLVLLSEFGAKKAVFDIVYEQDSPLAVNSDILKQSIPDSFQNQFKGITDNITGLFSALENGQISLADAKDYVSQLVGLTDQTRKQLLSDVDSIVQNNDNYLGDAARMFGNAYFTVNTVDLKNPVVTDERRQYAIDHFAVRNIKVINDSLVPNAADIIPAIPPIVTGARGAGFPRVVVDNDGVRRRIDLLYRYGKAYFPQLVFGPLLDLLKDPSVVVSPQTIVLLNAVLPGATSPTTIRIPLAPDGTMLINWPKKTFLNSFRHFSYYNLIYDVGLENDLIHNLRAMQQAGYFSVYQGSEPLLSRYNDAEKIKQTLFADPTDQERQQYREDRRIFFQNVGEFLNGTALQDILQQIDQVLATPGLAADQATYYKRLRNDVNTFFSSTEEVYKKLMDSRSTLAKELKDSFVIIGQTGTSTTDTGVNPFEKVYMNVGTHASIMNTILQRKFLDQAPWWIALIIAAAFSFGVSFAIHRMGGAASIVTGLGTTVLVLTGCAIYFLLTGMYVNEITPTVSVLVSFVSLTVIKFLRVGREKTFLRNAFNHYLSSDVINEIVTNPDMLRLGGEKKLLTAMFTDIRGFSSISEAMDPQDLVRLLNRYLGEMSNLILKEHGTIDKYEGDAIISFFGAPLDVGNHALNACRAALEMKRAEALLNQEFTESKLSASPLLTRIGINTGEMVVGNMGTLNRMDYTIMGHNVNLAARLEGVNKQYGTWLLISEHAYVTTERAFAVRRLDRVRVVGVKEPIRLFELIDEREKIDAATIELLRGFNAALNLFEEKRFADAEGAFREVSKKFPEDGPTKYYIERCEQFRKKPPADEWDGVFNLSSK